MRTLKIENLHVKVEGKEILKGINLEIKTGEVCALMGLNGSGKSTLAHALMGHPKYEITKGKISIDGVDITNISPDKRAKEGLFLSFQHPSEISGVTVSNFLRTAYNIKNGVKMNVLDFHKMLLERMELLRMDRKFATRYLNEGFSGGEKKRMEILQMAMLNPKFAILDETDSGLDIDALKTVADGINNMKTKDTGILIITHYQRILNYVKPNKVNIMSEGKIIKSGDENLASELEEKGYEWILNGKKQEE